MSDPDLQPLCETGQRHLVAMQYLQAEAALSQAAAIALRDQDWDTLSRVYMPLQECRRQKRQRCGEGTIKLDLLARDASDSLDVEQITRDYPQGQLLIAGWGSIDPALRLRRIARERQLYLETYLAAVYPISGGSRAVAIVPTADITMPPAGTPLDRLLTSLPPHSIVLNETELPRGEQRGNTTTYAHTMSLWERLHLPFLAQADATANLLARIDAYRRTIEVDYACELAHQRLSDSARELLRTNHR